MTTIRVIDPDRLFRCRSDAALTQTELARQVGSDQRMISEYEHRYVRASPDRIDDLARVLNVAPEAITVVIDASPEGGIPRAYDAMRPATGRRSAATRRAPDPDPNRNRRRTPLRTIPSAFRRWRETAGMDQVELARRVGVSARTIGRYETEARPIGADTLRDVATALGTDPMYLVTVIPLLTTRHD